MFELLLPKVGSCRLRACCVRPCRTDKMCMAGVQESGLLDSPEQDNRFSPPGLCLSSSLS